MMIHTHPGLLHPGLRVQKKRNSLTVSLSHLSGVWIPLFYALVLIALDSTHKYFTEWGGVMQYFAGKEILSGMGFHGWAAHFWPPLFSILIGLGSTILPGFFAGKLISIVSGSLLLYVAYVLARTLSNQHNSGLWVQAFLVVCPLFVAQSLEAHNHMLDSFLFVSGLAVFFKSLNEPTPTKTLIAGLLFGLAGLTRYTSYVALALPFFFLTVLDPRHASKLAIVFWSGFAVVSLPWWIYNLVNNGSLLSNWEYLNVCTAVPEHAYGTLRALWWCSGQSRFNNLSDVVFAYPTDYLRNVFSNIFEGSKELVKLCGVMALFVIPALLESIFSVKPKYWITLYGILALFIVMISLAGVNDYYLLSTAILITIVSVPFLLGYLARCQEWYPILKKVHFRSLFIAILFLTGLGLVGSQLHAFSNDPYYRGGLAELDQVTAALKAHDPNIQTKVVMAIDPARAYYAGSKYLETPFDYSGSIEGMISYQGLGNRVKAYAPKYPSTMEPSALRADYLIYTRTPPDLALWQPQDDPQFSFLLDPKSDQIPRDFELVYQGPDVVVYEIQR